MSASSTATSRRFARRPFVGLGLAIALALCGCSEKVLPAPGELLLLVSSDMQIPDSFDTMVVSFAAQPGKRYVYTSSEATKLRWEELESPGTSSANPCEPRVGDSLSVNLKLPATLALLSTQSDATRNEMTVSLCKRHEHLLTQRATVELPARGAISTQQISLRWLCADKSPSSHVGCFGCGNARCYGLEISANEASESPCAVAACQDAKAFPVTEYDAEDVARYRDNSDCFDVLGCFDSERGGDSTPTETFPVAIDWRLDDRGRRTDDCIAKLASTDEDLEHFNLALVLPPQTQGTCNAFRCWVALEAESDFGWSVDADDPSVLRLPAGICQMLDSGQILSGVATRRCEQRSRSLPICGTGNETSVPDEGVSTYGQALAQALNLSYSLDETPVKSTVFFDQASRFDLLATSLSNDDATFTSVDGVTNGGFAFDSQHFALSSVAVPHPPSYGVSLWLSLTELALLRHGQGDYLPILSTLAANCRSGFRLGLVTCEDGRVQLLFERPLSTHAAGRCRLESHYRELASRSWAGGYYSPWKRGDYRHIAVSYDEAHGATISVDGLPSPASPSDGACLARPTASGSPEDGYLYVGSNRDLADPRLTQTGPLEFDDLRLFGRALTADEVAWLWAHSQTKTGPGGFPWGAWATQGSAADLVSASPQSATAEVLDRAFSSAGLFALLREHQSNGLPASSRLVNLAEFDEAVLWARPQGKTFQFSLSADHGRRQCAWTLRTHESPLYVINLRQPNWCVDPNCSFALSQVERVSVASDWSSAEGEQSGIEVQALAFRKRLLTESETTIGTSDLLGGLPGPGGFCWRAVSYSPDALARLARSASTRGVALELLEERSEAGATVELAADLPVDESLPGARDFRACARVEVCFQAPLPPRPVQFALRNEVGQTATWDLAASNEPKCYVADLDAPGSTWPAGNEGNNGFYAPQDSDTVRASATRFSLRFSEDMEVTTVRCCAANGEECSPLGDTVPPHSEL